jgi:hypothetical protein
LVLASVVLSVALSLSGVPAGALADAKVFVEEDRLVADDGDSFDQFGSTVAIDGDRALVGAGDGDSPETSGTGAAYVFSRLDTGAWQQQAKLVPSEGDHDDEFGWSVALDGNRALVGAQDDDDQGAEAGSAYVFARQANGKWIEEAELAPGDLSRGDQFGFDVSLEDDTALVGAKDHNGAGSDSGAVFVFERSPNGTWSQSAELTGHDTAVGDNFGWSTALEGGSALVGAPFHDTGSPDAGAAYVFERGDGTWTEVTRLAATDGEAGDLFGWAVDLDGSQALVSAVDEDTTGTNAGAAYVYSDASSGTWTQAAKVVSQDGERDDNFGWSVAVEGDRLLIGARGDSNVNGGAAGSAYVFSHLGGSWTQESKLLASGGDRFDRFGALVALVEDTAVIGAVGDEGVDGAETGAAYAFAVEP